MARTQIEIAYDIDAGSVVLMPSNQEWEEDSLESQSSSDMEIATPVVSATYPVCYPYSAYRVLIQFLRHTGEPADLSAFSGEWDGAFGNPAEALHEISDGAINQADEANLSEGKVSIDFALPLAVSEDLGTASSKKHYLEIRATDGDAAVRVLGVIPVWTKQVVYVPVV